MLGQSGKVTYELSPHQIQLSAIAEKSDFQNRVQCIYVKVTNSSVVIM